MTRQSNQPSKQMQPMDAKQNILDAVKTMKGINGEAVGEAFIVEGMVNAARKRWERTIRRVFALSPKKGMWFVEHQINASLRQYEKIIDRIENAPDPAPAIVADISRHNMFRVTGKSPGVKAVSRIEPSVSHYSVLCVCGHEEVVSVEEMSSYSCACGCRWTLRKDGLFGVRVGLALNEPSWNFEVTVVARARPWVVRWHRFKAWVVSLFKKGKS